MAVDVAATRPAVPGGEGSGNKNWFRWGKPGQMVQGGPEISKAGIGTTVRTSITLKNKKVVGGSVIRFSTGSESGAPPCERFMYHDLNLWAQ